MEKVRDFKREICLETNGFPKKEKFRLSDQLIRSVRSINSAIAEGQGRFTYPEQIHFCILARGSLSETINHLIDAYDENYIDETRLIYFKIKGKEIERILNGYLAYLRRMKKGMMS
jgi:four helix bundle protein